MYEAYISLRKDAWDIQYSWAKKWESYVAIVQKLSIKDTLSFNDFIKESRANKNDIMAFLAFVTHTGLLQCLNERDPYEQRRYKIPILFQQPNPRKNSRRAG